MLDWLPFVAEGLEEDAAGRLLAAKRTRVAWVWVGLSDLLNVAPTVGWMLLVEGKGPEVCAVQRSGKCIRPC